ncbi:MAG: Ig-like domain-containing protein, partial [Myxococcota bacterium]
MQSFLRGLRVLAGLLAVLALAAACGKEEEPAGPTDQTPPTVVATDPTDGAMAVPRGAALSVTFSEAVREASLTPEVVVLHPTGAGDAYVTLSYVSAEHKLVITPAATLELYAPYTLTVGTGVRDVAGNALATPYVVTFETADDVAPIQSPLPGPPRPYIAVPILALTWSPADDRGSGVAYYRVQVSSDETAGGVFLEQSADGPSWSYTGTDGERLYVRIAAVDGQDNVSDFTPFVGPLYFDFTPPSAPVQAADAGELDDALLHVAWSAALDVQSGIIAYRVRVARDAASTDSLVLEDDVANLTSYDFDVTTEHGETLYTQVAARNGAGVLGAWSPWSDGVTIDATAPDGPSAVVDEGPNSREMTARFIWSAATDDISGVTGYWVQVSLSPDDTSLVVDASIGDVLLYDYLGGNGDTLYARVRARNGAGVWGDYCAFSDGIRLDATAPGRPLTPSDDGPYTASDGVSFGWSAVVDAATYVLQVGTHPGANDVFDANVGAVVTYTLDVAADPNGRSYYARVAGVSATAVQGTWSNPSDGITRDLTPPGAPGTPSDAGTLSPRTVRFDWSAATDAESGIASYFIQVATAPSVGSVVYETGDITERPFLLDAAAWQGATLYARVAAVNPLGQFGDFSLFSDGVLVDASAPWVSWSAPWGGFTSAADDVQIMFNEPMNRASVEGAFVLEGPEASEPVHGYLFVWSTDSTTVTILPDTQDPAGITNVDILAEVTEYTLRVATTAMDVAGNALSPAHDASFTTRAGTPAQLTAVVSATSNVLAGPVPVGDVEGGDIMTFTFDEDMNVGYAQATVTGRTIELSGSVGTGFDGGLSLSYTTPTTLVMTLSPRVALEAGEEYQIDLWGVYDAATNFSGGRVLLQVRASAAADAHAPEVLSLVPGDDDSNVDPRTPLIVTFSEPIDVSTLATGVTVTAAGLLADDIEQSYGLNDLQATLLLFPHRGLPPATAVTVSMVGLRDLAGNALASPVVATFTTRAATDTGVPALGDTAPPAGALAQAWEIEAQLRDSVSGEVEVLVVDSVGRDDILITDTTTGLPRRGYRVETRPLGSTLTLRPPSTGPGFQTDHDYEVQLGVGSGIEDLFGHVMVPDSFAFRFAGPGTNRTPYLGELDQARVVGHSTPSLRALGAALRLHDDDGDLVSIAIDGPGVSIADALDTSVHDRYEYGSDGPPAAAEPGMDDATYPQSGFYPYTITLDDSVGGTSTYARDVWVWHPDDVPRITSVAGVVPSGTRPVRIATNTPIYVWENIDTLHAQLVQLMVADMARLGRDGPAVDYMVQRILHPQMTSLETPSRDALPIGLYLWTVIELRMPPGFGAPLGQGWALDISDSLIEPMFVFGPSNDALTAQTYGVGDVAIDLGNTGTPNVGRSHHGSCAFDGDVVASCVLIDARGETSSPTEYYAYDEADGAFMATASPPSPLPRPTPGARTRDGALWMTAQAAAPWVPS